jgi:hypothetical protein
MSAHQFRRLIKLVAPYGPFHGFDTIAPSIGEIEAIRDSLGYRNWFTPSDLDQWKVGSQRSKDSSSESDLR